MLLESQYVKDFIFRIQDTIIHVQGLYYEKTALIKA